MGENTIEKLEAKAKAEAEIEKYQSRTPISFEQLAEIVNKRLLLKNNDVLKVLLATVISNKLGTDPVWLMLIAPSGGTKTELLRSLQGIPKIYFLSDLTPQTFLSGDIRNKKASLLNRLENGTILIYKDFTTILTLQRDARHAILSQLREIYDGFISKEFGTGERKSWSGKLGFIAGCTPVIDNYNSLYQTLGERFLQFRVEMPDSIELSLKAIGNVGDEKALRIELQNAFADYLIGIEIPEERIEAPDYLKQQIANLATFCTKARSSVIRDEFHKDEILLTPEPEAPTRFAKQLITYALAFSLMDKEKKFTEYRILYQIALDSIPANRREILKAVIKNDDWLSTADIAKNLTISAKTVERTLEELRCVGLLEKDDEKKYLKGNLWRLKVLAKAWLKNSQFQEAFRNDVEVEKASPALI